MDERATNRRFFMATRLPIGSNDAETPPASKAARLSALLRAPALSFIMEAHNGLSAKIVEEAGFEGIWASGLSMSAALGVRDNNEASWTQVLEMLEFMADATTVPILVDGDTGYGNFNNVRRPGAKALPARHRRGLHRGQAVPQDQLLHWREPAAGGRGRVLRPHQGGQGQPERRRLPDRGPRRGADRRLGHGGSAAPRRGLSRRRRRCGPHPLQKGDRRRDHRLLRSLGGPHARGDRAHHVPPHADADLSGTPVSPW